MSFNEYLNSLEVGIEENQWTQEEKDALELAYYVSETILTDEDYNFVTSADEINKHSNSNEKYGVWKTLDTNVLDEQRNLGLKVGDYVIIAIRIKEEKLSSETNKNGFVIKDGNHTPSSQTRAYGFKIHADQINVNWNSMRLSNVGLVENVDYGLDGYAMLQSISLIPDSNENYLGVDLKLKLFNEFYRNRQNEILVTGSNQVLVKRDNANAISTGTYYKDASGQDIIDNTGQRIPIYYDSKGMLPKPIKASLPTREKELIELRPNVFMLELNPNDVAAEYSFFKNQDIEIEFVNKKGNATEEDEYDFYVDSQVSRSYVVNNQIKFPIPNDTNIQYSFNSEEFVNFINDQQNINNGTVYVNSLNPQDDPVNGQASLIAQYKVIRTENGQSTLELATLADIKQKIQEDFGGKVALRATHTSVNGAITVLSDADISSINSLQNGDRFKVEIVSADEENYIFAQQIAPLIFTINGLYERAIDQKLLQHLRVQQTGYFDGEGSFNVFVHDPKLGDTNLTLEEQLGGYKFMIRVWNSDKEIKHDWTSEFITINNLSNGDKVEWKLVSPSGAPLQESYYNTVAGQHSNSGYSFNQVNMSGNGNILNSIEGIGKNPHEANAYPESTGFIIANLKEKTDTDFTITYDEFARVMNSMNFRYTGVNGSGNMVSDLNAENIIVNTKENMKEVITLKHLLDNKYVKFYYNNNSNSDMNEFDWVQSQDENGNWISSPGILSNGDVIKVIYENNGQKWVWNASKVSGLIDKSDDMSAMSWVGIGVASVLTLGIFFGIYVIARNRKLKSKLK